MKKLIQADSGPEAGELKVSGVIQQAFAGYGIECDMDVWDGNRANVVARVRTPGRKKALMIVCHHDVVSPGNVPWDHDPLSGLEQDGTIYGRGATDMKGGIAAVVTAMGQLVSEGAALQGDILFAATAGEETDSCGVDRFVQTATDLPDLAGIMIPEPTGFNMINAHRGLLWLEISTYGKTAHGSKPHLGVNAIKTMALVLDRLETAFDFSLVTHPNLGTGSMSINTISGGKALNVVPDHCCLGVDIRTLPGQDQQALMAHVQALLDSLATDDSQFEADVTIQRSMGALETDPECGFVKAVCEAVDIHELNAVGFT
ncbi:MAG: M20 family metallopeptidase, partial [Planctomycetes bacterium]|nr:M20 family metallopeptidase [Planctomycetota bacterium]